MQFLLLITHDDWFVPTEGLVADIHRWDEEMDARGLRLEGKPLRPPADALTVRVRDGAPEVTAGPAVAGSGQTAAYELLECSGLDEAIEAAARHPMAAAGAIEVRPVWEELT